MMIFQMTNSWFWRSFRKEFFTHFLFGKKIEVPLVDVSKVRGMFKFFFFANQEGLYLPSWLRDKVRNGFENVFGFERWGKSPQVKPCLKRQRIRVPMLVLGWFWGGFANFQPFDSLMYQSKSLFLELIPTFPNPFLLKVALMSSKKHPQVSPVDRAVLGNLFEGVYASGLSHCLFGKRETS